MSQYLLKFSSHSCGKIYNKCSKNVLSQSSICEFSQYNAPVHCTTKNIRFPILREIRRKCYHKELSNKRSFVTLSKYDNACSYKFQNQVTAKERICVTYFNQIPHMRDLCSRLEDQTQNAETSSLGSLDSIPTFHHLLSYLDVSIESGDVNHAENILLQFTQDTNVDYGNNTVALFNIVLHGWANEGNFTKISELLDKMELMGIEPNLQSFCAAIESIARSSSDKNIIKKILAKIDERSDLHLENLLDECEFVSDQREKILEGIRLVNPNFNPKRSHQSFVQNAYSSDLLKEFKSDTTQRKCRNTLNNFLTIEELHHLVELQFERECATQIHVPTILEPVTDDFLHWRRVWNNYIETWKECIKESFQDSLPSLEGKTSYCGLYPYMTIFKPEVYANISLQEMLNVIQNPKTPSLIRLQLNIGNAIMKHYFIQKKRKNGVLDKIKTIHKKFIEYYYNPDISAKYTAREYWDILQENFSIGPTPIHSDKFWPTEVVQNIGAFMVEIITRDVLIDEDPFHLSTERKRPIFNVTWNQKSPLIRCTGVVKKLFSAAYGDELTMMNSITLPMISPPLPWSSFYTGGFLTHSVSALRLPREFAENYQKQIGEPVSNMLNDVFDALNTLSGCAWKINEPILDIVIDIYKKGGNPDLGVPLLLENEQKGGFQIERSNRRRNYTELTSPLEILTVKEKSSFERNKRSRIKFALSIANAFRKHIIWQPVRIDFTGRPLILLQDFKLTGTFTPDIINSLLLFANGEEIGEKGIEWLKIHLINLADIQENFSSKQKIEYCNKILDDVMDSADNPLMGRKWWMNSKFPWQTLACCIELTNCLRSPHPQKYICHLPIFQTSSNSTVQHYSALLRDEQCAELVNLVPLDQPLNVYTKLAEKMELERKEDEAKNIRIAQMLDGYINRDVARLILDTICYGASTNGIFLKMFLLLNRSERVFPAEHQEEAAVYLTGKAVRMAQTMFSSTKQLQSWLNKLASLISKAYQEPIQWNSPFGFPITLPQPSQKIYSENIEEEEGLAFDINSTENERLLDIERKKKSLTINYIMCLEAAHKLLIALHCDKRGIEIGISGKKMFTLPSSVDVLNQIAREQFVALYSQPLLENLANDMADLCVTPTNYDDSLPSELLQVLNSAPQPGNFDIKKVLNSTSFFY